MNPDPVGRQVFIKAVGVHLRRIVSIFSFVTSVLAGGPGRGLPSFSLIGDIDDAARKKKGGSEHGE